MDRIEILPGQGTSLVRLGAREDEIIRHAGSPIEKDLRSSGDLRLIFKNFVTILETPQGPSVEIIVLPQSQAILNDRDLFNATIGELLLEFDGEVWQGLGYTVFVKHNIAFDGFDSLERESRFITLYTPGRWNMDGLKRVR